jgi:hypothetical protein
MMSALKDLAKAISNIHRPNGEPNVFLFSTPRSGSTWLMELIGSQPGFKYCNEPLNLRKPLIQKYLGISEWQDLCRPDASEALYRYFKAICEGRLHFLNQSPLHGNYRLITHRIVFKIIHGGEDRINWFRDSFNGQVVYLLRHPVAVSLSRKGYPRLEAFLSSDYSNHFTGDQLRRARKILDSGTRLERGVLSWCFENAVPLREATGDWAMLSYEQLVQDPHPIIKYLADKLELPKPARIMNRLAIPSGSHWKSDMTTKAILRQGTERRSMLVQKWRKQLAQPEARRAMEILQWFELDVYDSDDVLPRTRFWVVAPPGGDAITDLVAAVEKS